MMNLRQPSFQPAAHPGQQQQQQHPHQRQEGFDDRDKYRSVNDHASNMINSAAANSLANLHHQQAHQHPQSQPASLRQVSFGAEPASQQQVPPFYPADSDPYRNPGSYVPEHLRSARQNGTGRSIQKATAEAAEQWTRRQPQSAGTGGNSDAMVRRSVPSSGSRSSVRKPRRSSSASKSRSQLMDVVGSQAECTFQPQVRELPDTYEGASLLKSYQKVDFTERVALWQQQKKQELARRKENVEDETMADCTFQPRINETSERVLAGQNRNKPIEERLYYDTMDRHARRRKQLIDKARAQAQAEFSASCSFKPKISRKSERYARQRSMRSASAGPATSRMRRQKLQAMEMSANGRGSTNRGGGASDADPDLTFQPQTNKVRRDMVSAKNYLKQNWVDRLSKPHPSQLGNSDGDESEESFFSDSGNDKENEGRARSRGRRQSSTPMPYQRRTKKKTSRPSSAPPPRRGRTNELSNREKRESFQNFIQKQKTRAEQQKKRLEKSRINNTPSFQPQITRRAQNHKQPRDFLERVKMHSDHWQRTRSEDGRGERFDQLMKNVANKGQYSSGQAFQPWLTKKSRTARPRKWGEMSTGDQRRREERRRVMKLQADNRLRKEATFEPHFATRTSKLAPQTEGHLKILTDPESYVDRVRSRTHALNTKTRRVQQKADLDEFAECTFHPQTKKVPKYITRISQTMKMAKELRRQQALEDGEDQPEKPEWR
eukprot:INCI17891.2.p1 GENE.INCI17891.2~~INCI17891.2.p1  ORF type:complete len:720 (+),score=132.40 INCI17891.2:875-3034(+)